jgi:hypothetical protein
VSHVAEPRQRLTIDVRYTVRDGRRWIVVAVRHEGVGGEPTAIARLFEPLYTTRQRGMAMGLAVGPHLDRRGPRRASVGYRERRAGDDVHDATAGRA